MLLEMSAGGAVLIAVILLLRRRLLHRLPKWTFLLLWAAALCRLLIPFTIPSPISVYTGAAWVAQTLEQEEAPAAPTGTTAPELPLPVTVLPPAPEDGWTFPAVSLPPPEPESKPSPINPAAAVYWTGTALCGLFFLAAYLWGLRRFWESVPAEQEFILRWQREHPALLPVRIQCCAAVNAPLAYGLLRPTVLLPPTTDWSDEDQLTYILTHEYVHIRRGDLLWKLLLTAALCVHWFNPLMWVMYFCANRDLELACDEQVIRILGLDSRKGYACALLSVAESGFSPLCLTYTTKNHMEERIRAIMKMKKCSAAAVLAAALLVTGVTAVFATSKAPPKDIDGLPKAVMSNQGSAGNTSAANSADASAPAIVPAPDERVHPVTGQPAGEQDGTVPGEETPIGPYYYDLPEGHLHRDALTPNPANCWGIPEGTIEPGMEIFAHNEEEYREMVRQLRMMGYDGHIGPIRYGYQVGAVIDKGYDGVQRTLETPEGIMPDWTYPVNSKGETYGTLGNRGWLGYDPDLIAVVATNGAEGYMTAEDLLYGQSGRYPVYDLEHENIVGYFEIGSQISSEVQAKIDALTGLENRWGVPSGEIPQWAEFTVADFEDAKELGKYLEATHGLYPGDYTPGCIRSEDGTRYIVQIDYSERAIRERLPDGVYPVNSKGETYGTTRDHIVVGYNPDLVLVLATNGKDGYAFEHDLTYGGYPGEIVTLEDSRAYSEWLETQPDILYIPVYDVNRDNIIGCFGLTRRNGLTPEEELKMVEDQMRHNMGLSEEEIAKQLEELKAAKGWS